MQAIRRSAFRATGSSPCVSSAHLTRLRWLSTSSAPSSRLASTAKNTSPLQKNKNSIIASLVVARRWASDDRYAAAEAELMNSSDAVAPQAADAHEQSAVDAAVGSSSSSGFSMRRGSDGDRGRDSRSRSTEPPRPNPGIYVGNIPFDATAEMLEEKFGGFGTVIEAIVAKDAQGRSKGFGYVNFDSVDAATKAIEDVHLTDFEGRRVVVNFRVTRAPYFSAGGARGEQHSTSRWTQQQSQPPSQPPSKSLFIGNMPFEMTDTDLNQLFRQIADVLDVRVAVDRRTGQPRGFAHADFATIEAAQAAAEVLREKQLYGRRLRIDFSGGERRGGSRTRDDASSSTSD